MDRQYFISAFQEGKTVEYKDGWVGWTEAIWWSVKTAPLELLRVAEGINQSEPTP